ncbi:MAG: hypothetical protein AAF842_12560, partial [Planctomycetota bacterium]
GWMTRRGAPRFFVRNTVGERCRPGYARVMWRNLPENNALRWDAVDQGIIGCGLVICTLLLIPAGIMHFMTVNHAKLTGDAWPFAGWYVDHGFSLILGTYCAAIALSIAGIAYPQRTWLRCTLVLTFLVMSIAWAIITWEVFIQMFFRGMRSVI